MSYIIDSSSVKKDHDRYMSLPDEVKRYLPESDFELLITAVDIMIFEEIYNESFSSLLNYEHSLLWQHTTNKNCDMKERQAIKKFMIEVFPRPYLEDMEEWRPGILDNENGRNLNKTDEKDRV
jgi:hypothetical protein